MRRLLIPSAVLIAAAGCSDGGGGTSAAVATTVTVAPGTVTFDAVGATRVVRASVIDQRGSAMTGVALSWTSSSAAATVASAGGDSAIVTAAGNGAATITATAGTVSGAATAQVAQAPNALQKAGGDDQAAPAGTALPQPLRVVAVDRLGAAVQGITVSFAVNAGGGSLSTASAVTGADGSATTAWTLGTGAGAPQAVTATAAGIATVQFTAVARAGAPVASAAVAGDGQTAGRNAAVAVAPRVRVQDAYGNTVPGVSVVFTVTSGGGSVTGATQTTDAFGFAQPTRWSLGSASGVNTLTATFPGSGLPAIVFTATAVNAGTLVPVSTTVHAAMAGTAVPARPAVVVRDDANNPVAGIAVTFTATSGGGTVTGGTVTTDATGTATVGGWQLGGVAAPNTLTATVADLSAAPVVFTAIGCSGGGGSGYALTLCFTAPVTPTQRAAYVNAAARWSQVITGDLPSLDVQIDEGDCYDGSPALDFSIDDLVIFASVQPIDGPGAILGQAAWCFRRTGGLPIIGLMRFDAADVASLEASGRFVDVVLHEMGHVIGLSSSIWSPMGLLKNPSSAGNVADTYFDGAGAIAAFNSVGGNSYAGQKVPVENTGGAGTYNSHWRENVLDNELMTGYINYGSPNPLSVITVRALADMGYGVDLNAADSYTLGASLQESPGRRIHLVNDEFQGPRWTIDRAGRRTRLPR